MKKKLLTIFFAMLACVMISGITATALCADECDPVSGGGFDCGGSDISGCSGSGGNC